MNWLTLSITLFLVMDPFGNVPVLMGMLDEVSPKRRRIIILRESLIALGLLLLFLVAGPKLMNLLGLEQPSLSVAGGVVLFLIALRMLFPSKGGVMGEDKIGGEPLIVPIATPLIAGPSAIATVILIHGTSENWFVEGLIGVGLAWALGTSVLLFAATILRLLGRRLMVAAERLTGLLLTVIAVQMILGGIKVFLAGL
ncbi:MAG: MarC family protein [Phycisphaeraceae bacterium]|nr:MarC family protein [Phycisphaeraceae bacterium]